jgi:hypothetical protein
MKSPLTPRSARLAKAVSMAASPLSLRTPRSVNAVDEAYLIGSSPLAKTIGILEVGGERP